MDSRKWAVLFATFVEDFRGKSLEEIRDGCRRYRRNAENRFFPTPGQLLEACKNPFDVGGTRRHYEPVPELPQIGQCVSPEKMREDIAKHGIARSGEKSIAMVKEEILARPKIPYVESTPQQKAERMAALERRLNARKTG